MARSSLYRSDLLLTLEAGGSQMPLEVAAELCGFEYRKPEPEPVPLKLEKREPLEKRKEPEEPIASKAGQSDREKLSFWVAESITVEPEEAVQKRRELPEIIRSAIPLDNDDFIFDERATPGKELVAWHRMWPFLREVLGRRRESRRPDIPQVVRRMAEGRPLQRIPRLKRRAWHPKAVILIDRRLALSPFWDDYDSLLRRLRKMRGDSGLKVIHLESFEGRLFDSRDPERDWTAQCRRAAVLALGDLGQYPGDFAFRPWLAIGRRLRRAGIQPWALCPCPRDRWSPGMTRVWSMAYWDRGERLSPRTLGQRAVVIPPQKWGQSTYSAFTRANFRATDRHGP